MSNVHEHDSARPNLPRRLGISLATLALLGAGAVSATQAFAGTGDAGAGAAASGTVTVQTAVGKGTEQKATKAKGKATKGKATKGKATKGKADGGRLADLPFPAAGEALQAAVSEVLPGATITNVQGQRTLADEHFPEYVWASADLGPGEEGVSVFHLTGGWGSFTAREYVESCPDEADDCQVSTLPDGTIVKSYSMVMVDTPTGPWTLYRVERLVDGVVIGLTYTAGRADDEKGSALAPTQPLTIQQLVDVAAKLQPLR